MLKKISNVINIFYALEYRLTNILMHYAAPTNNMFPSLCIYKYEEFFVLFTILLFLSATLFNGNMTVTEHWRNFKNQRQ